MFGLQLTAEELAVSVRVVNGRPIALLYVGACVDYWISR